MAATSKSTIGKKVQKTLTKTQKKGQDTFRKKYGGVKNFTPKSTMELSKMTKTELNKYLKVLNTEANRRLESAVYRLNKDLNVGEISEFKVNATNKRVIGLGEQHPIYNDEGKVVDIKYDEYGFRAFKVMGNSTKQELIQQIFNRQLFLNKKTSTTSGQQEADRHRKEAIERTLSRMLGGKNVKLSKDKAERWGKLLEKLRDKGKISREFGSNPNLMGTNEVLQDAYDVMNNRDYKDLDADQLYKLLEEKWLGDKSKGKNEMDDFNAMENSRR